MKLEKDITNKKRASTDGYRMNRREVDRVRRKKTEIKINGKSRRKGDVSDFYNKSKEE